MARQAEDRVTFALQLPDVPRKRGRPATGRALSAAERMRAKRQRDRKAVNRAVTGSGNLGVGLVVLSDAALARFMLTAMRDGAVSSVKAASDEFIARARSISRNGDENMMEKTV